MPVRTSQQIEASGLARRDENSADSDVEDMDTLHAPQQVGQYNCIQKSYSINMIVCIKVPMAMS